MADAPILEAFQQVVEDSDKHHHLFKVVRQVKELLNTGKEFEVSLTTTFGQPLPLDNARQRWSSRRARSGCPPEQQGTPSPTDLLSPCRPRAISPASPTDLRPFQSREGTGKRALTCIPSTHSRCTAGHD